MTLSPYVKRAEMLTGKSFDGVDCRWANEADLAGDCLIDRDDFGIVTGRHMQFVPSTWGVLTEFERELVVLHEAGHCVFGRQHLNDMSAGYPVSIMYWWPLEGDLGNPLYVQHYEMNFKAYLSELTHQCTENCLF